MKIDLHLHSKHSKRPSQWVLQKIGAPESFSEPAALLRMTKKLGMDSFTLTDHNTIDGCLEMAHIPGVFISEEATSYFPDDGCKVHVLVHNINESIHRQVQRLRENIYDLVRFLSEENIAHALAHPLYSVNHRLTPEHIEKLFLLFKVLEFNGARDEAQNKSLEYLVSLLDQKTMDRLADKHGITPPMDRPWEKYFIGGSDDHGSLNAARRYTEAPGANSIREFFRQIASGRAVPRGAGSSPRTMAHNLYGITYQFFNARFNLQRYVGMDYLVRYLDRMLRPEHPTSGRLMLLLKGLWEQAVPRRPRADDDLKEVIRSQSEKVIQKHPEFLGVVKNGGPSPGIPKEDQWFSFVDRVSNKVLYHFGEKLIGCLSGADFFSMFGSIGAAGSNYFLVAPYFVAFGLFGRDRHLTKGVIEHFQEGAGRKTQPPETKMAHFTDTLYDINGVALTLRQQARLAEATGKELTMVTCSRGRPKWDGRVRNFEPITEYSLPEYPQQKVILPPFLQMLSHVYERGYTCLHTATPGPMGLAALGIARVLKLPISGTYHTQIPQYAAYLTNDQNIEELTWRYILWYYDQMDSIYAPSYETAQELKARGVDPDKLRVYPRGVDIELFNPKQRNGFLKDHFGVGDEVKAIYVGRVSKEKNLPVLVEAFKRAFKGSTGIRLVVVGDGPYLDEMKQELRGRPCTFTGYLRGIDLAQAYASADFFVFPSTTDTFGNVILEAQASGLPVIVTDSGGPRENVAHNETGFIIAGGDAAALEKALLKMASDPQMRLKMGRTARRRSELRSFQKAFNQHWDMYARDQAAFHSVDWQKVA